jgi:general secretion pathway protein G
MTEVSTINQRRIGRLFWGVAVGSVLLVGAVMVLAIHNSYVNAPPGVARLKLNELEKALRLYSIEVGELPSPSEGLNALRQPPDGSKPFLKEKAYPKDPWGEPYLYHRPGPGLYALASKGPDRQEGTEDDLRIEGKVLK